MTLTWGDLANLFDSAARCGFISALHPSVYVSWTWVFSLLLPAPLPSAGGTSGTVHDALGFGARGVYMATCPVSRPCISSTPCL